MKVDLCYKHADDDMFSLICDEELLDWVVDVLEGRVDEMVARQHYTSACECLNARNMIIQATRKGGTNE